MTRNDRSLGPYAALAQLWGLAGLGPESLRWAGIDGRDPALPSTYRVGTAAASTIAATALAASELWLLRGGRQAGRPGEHGPRRRRVPKRAPPPRRRPACPPELGPGHGRLPLRRRPLGAHTCRLPTSPRRSPPSARMRAHEGGGGGRTAGLGGGAVRSRRRRTGTHRRHDAESCRMARPSPGQGSRRAAPVRA